jgi:large subunit ribosomal protein L6
MSRKGKLPIPMPKGVEIKINKECVSVHGPKGTLSQNLVPGVHVEVVDGEIVVSLTEEYASEGRLHGLYRSLIDNMVLGVSKGFEKKLEMIGVGYRAAVKGHLLDLQVGFSHPTGVDIPKGIEVKVEKNTLIQITGIDKRVVGQFAADVRGMRPPEPYQGKGIRYQNEYVRKKAGKAAGK